MSTTTAILYIVAAGFLMSYPFSVVWRVREWEIKRRRAGKSLLWGWVAIPVSVIAFYLGVMMLVLGSEVLKGNIKI